MPIKTSQLDALLLIPEGSFPMGFRTNFIIDLKKNALPTRNPELREKLFGTIVSIQGQLYNVVGIEGFAAGDEFDHTQVGLLCELIINRY